MCRKFKPINKGSDPSLNAEFVVKDINWDYEYSDSNHPQVSNFTDEDGEAFDQHDLSKYELDAEAKKKLEEFM